MNTAPTVVCLDGYTANPGDLSWEPIRALAASLTVYDRTPASEAADRARHAACLLTNKTQITAELMDACPKLRYIGLLSTGTNAADLDAARARNITVTNVPAYSTPGVAQATIALLLELTNAVGHHTEAVRAGRWTTNEDFCFWDSEQVELAGRTFGILGYGAIGRAVARIAHALGMRIIVHTRTPPTDPDIAFVSQSELFSQSDVLSLHCPLSEATERIINAVSLGLMKPTAYLLNTSRGGLVDEHALAHALNHDQLAGAGVDVLSQEPPTADNPLLSARNCLITPHLAWAALAARRRLLETVCQNLQAWLNETPQNVVT